MGIGDWVGITGKVAVAEGGDTDGLAGPEEQADRGLSRRRNARWRMYALFMAHLAMHVPRWVWYRPNRSASVVTRIGGNAGCLDDSRFIRGFRQS